MSPTPTKSSGKRIPKGAATKRPTGKRPAASQPDRPNGKGSKSTKAAPRPASTSTPAAGSAEAGKAATEDVNVVSLEGRLATAPDVRAFESGARLARLLVTVRSDVDRPRTDVIPVTVWNPEPVLSEAARGDRVTVRGTVQRRFWTDVDGRKSRVEVVASAVEVSKAAPGG